jgi:hypothetical protein
MNLFRCTALVLALTTVSLALPAQAEEAVAENSSGDPVYSLEAPRGYAMMGDLIIARPMLVALTAIGTAAFVVSLPFTALGGNVKEAGRSLVLDPGKEAFVRCLGCTTSGYDRD